MAGANALMRHHCETACEMTCPNVWLSAARGPPSQVPLATQVYAGDELL